MTDDYSADDISIRSVHSVSIVHAISGLIRKQMPETLIVEVPPEEEDHSASCAPCTSYTSYLSSVMVVVDVDKLTARTDDMCDRITEIHRSAWQSNTAPADRAGGHTQTFRQLFRLRMMWYVMDVLFELDSCQSMLNALQLDLELARSLIRRAEPLAASSSSSSLLSCTPSFDLSYTSTADLWQSLTDAAMEAKVSTYVAVRRLTAAAFASADEMVEVWRLHEVRRSEELQVLVAHKAVADRSAARQRQRQQQQQQPVSQLSRLSRL